MPDPAFMLRALSRATRGERAQLIVCPFGGASYGFFRSWSALLPPTVSAALAIYPGRDQRAQEPAIENVEQVARQLAAALLRTSAGERTILAGHSLGAQIAFEACHVLARSGVRLGGLVLSACHAPHLRPRRTFAELGDDAFVAELVRLGGSPAELLTNPELKAHYVPLLRADFRAGETYHRPLALHRPLLELPALLLYGEADPEARSDELDAWRLWLNGRVELRAIPGDHFYITRNAPAFLSHLSQTFPWFSEQAHVQPFRPSDDFP